MQNTKLDIVELIEQNPIVKLSKNYENKFIDKIQENFTESQQQLFISSFYTYLNYNSKTDFVIELESVWKWLGFSRKDPAKRVLEKHFKLDVDYKINIAPPTCGAIPKGGENKEKILMSINTFKKLCLKSDTKKADEIHDYFIKLEETLQEVITEESEELKLQLLEKDKLIKCMENQPTLKGFHRKMGFIYLITDTCKNFHYKIGYAGNTQHRLGGLNCGSSTTTLKLVQNFETCDKEFAERIIHCALQPFKINLKNEWFYIKNDKELNYTINTIKDCIQYIEKYNIKDYNQLEKEFKLIQNNLDIKTQLIQNNLDIKTQLKQNNDKINKNIVQQMHNKTGNFKGVFWNEEKYKWKSELKKDYINIFLGYFDTELEGAKVYNNYALFLNQNENCNYSLNEIENYTTSPLNIPEINKNNLINNHTSKYTGVVYDKNRKYYKASIKFNKKTLYLGYNDNDNDNDNDNEIECAKIYNQQALYYNNHQNTKYILNEIPNYVTIEKDIYSELQTTSKTTTSSQYFGVTFCRNKWKAYYVLNKKQIIIGNYTNELDAAKAYNNVIVELNKNGISNYKVNKLI
jgi:hypothetical protein